MTKTALIIGIDSHIGAALAQQLRASGWKLFGTSRRTPQNDPHIFFVDLENESTIKNIHGFFDVIYACAAITNMAFCENNPELSKQVNFSSQIALAKHCLNKTNHYIFMSTAGVFAGDKPKYAITEHTTPKCIYGTHKAMCEQLLINLSERITIVRTTKVITRDNNLVLEWLQKLNSNQPIQPFNDMTLSAVTIDAIVNLLQKLAAARSKNRIVHISGANDILYSDFALMLAQRLNKPDTLIQSRSYTSVGITPTTVFPYSSLDMAETTREYGIQPCTMQDILDQAFEIRISIVLPNYNHARYLPTALNHALQQKTPAWEIIVIDDASTDNSLAVIQEYANKYPQIRVMRNEKNMGVIYGLNVGLQAVTGSHVTFAAADDWMEPTFLQHATQLLQAHPDAGLVSGTSWIIEEGKEDKPFTARSPLPMSDAGYIAPNQARKLLNRLDSWFMGNTVVYNVAYTRAEGGFNPALQSFTDNFLCRVLAAKHGCCFTPEKLATWRILPQGYAKGFSVDANRQILVFNTTINLLKENYHEVFSPNTIYKIQQRFNFNLARTIWNQQQGKLSPQLKQHLQSSLPGKWRYHIATWLLFISSKIPVGSAALGRLALFLCLRPFDIWQQLRIQTSS